MLYFTGWLQDQPNDQHHTTLCTGLEGLNPKLTRGDLCCSTHP